jgi:hypothetical protein
MDNQSEVITPTAPQVARWNLNLTTALAVAAGSTKAGLAGTTPMAWTGLTQAWQQMGVAIKAAAGATGPPNVLMAPMIPA